MNELLSIRQLEARAIRLAHIPGSEHAECWESVGALFGLLYKAQTLLTEGRELSLSNQRAASMRHRLVAWGDSVEAFLSRFAVPHEDPAND